MTREQVRQAVEKAEKRAARLNGFYRNDCCASCLHWNYTEGIVAPPEGTTEELAWGCCHRYPPVLEGTDFVWPSTKYYEHCGEHKAVG